MALEPVTLDIPYYDKRPGGLKAESSFLVKGLIPEQSKRFYIEFADARHKNAKCLRLDVCFEDHSNEAFVELYHLKKRLWRQKSHLQLGGRFTIKIIVTRDHYKIYADHQLLDDFPHYLPPKDAIFLTIGGDVILEDFPQFLKGH